MTEYDLHKVLKNARDLSKIDLLRFFTELGEKLKKAKETIDYNNSLVEDDAAVAMLGISRIVNLKNEIEELKVFIKVLNRLA